MCSAVIFKGWCWWYSIKIYEDRLILKYNGNESLLTTVAFNDIIYIESSMYLGVCILITTFEVIYIVSWSANSSFCQTGKIVSHLPPNRFGIRFGNSSGYPDLPLTCISRLRPSVVLRYAHVTYLSRVVFSESFRM